MSADLPPTADYGDTNPYDDFLNKTRYIRMWVGMGAVATEELLQELRYWVERIDDSRERMAPKVRERAEQLAAERGLAPNGSSGAPEC